MKMTPTPSTAVMRLLSGIAAFAALACVSLRAQDTTATPTPTPTPTTETPAASQEAVTLDPFTVTTTQDRGYAATNEISGSRINTPIQDIPISINVITSQFISDIGATNLRSALQYQAGIMTVTQNDLENTEGAIGSFGGSAYGPGGVNNPQGVTANPDESNYKIEGFIATNTLRDGFLRLSGVDSSNIERIEVIYGANALLYGTGNFGGVVDYLPKRPMDTESGDLTLSYGTDGFARAQLGATGPLIPALHLDYRLDMAYQENGAETSYYKDQILFFAPQLQMKPTDRTTLLLDFEYGRENINGDGFQAFRGISSATPNLPSGSDQLEAVGFYYPPGADPRSYNITGPDTFIDTQQKNLELKATQSIWKENGFMPSIDFLIGYNRSNVQQQARQVNGIIEEDPLGPAGVPLNNGYALSETIITSSAANSVGGQGASNGNLVFGPSPNSVIAYTWNENWTNQTRDQERIELVGGKTYFAGKWYEWNNQVLAGYSDLFQDGYSQAGGTNGTNYWSPNSIAPIMYGTQGDGSPDVVETVQNATETKNWDSAYYLNYYGKLFKDRLIIMSGIRRDVNASWDNSQAGSSLGVESNSLKNKTYQNGIMLGITKWLNVFYTKSEGILPNFGGLRNAATGAPVSSNSGKNNTYGLKLDAFHGKLTATLTHYVNTSQSWVGSPWFSPAPLGRPRFNPNDPVVYNISDADSGNSQGMNPNGVTVGGITWAGGTGGVNDGTNGATQSLPLFNAAVAAGAVYVKNSNYSNTSAGNPQNQPELYISPSNPAGAAYLDYIFLEANAPNYSWPGWLYSSMDIPPYGGGSHDDLNLNNGTMDAGGFLNTGLNPALQVEDESRGWTAEIAWTPNDAFQIVGTAQFDASDFRINPGTWPAYPYVTYDRWEPWFNPFFGLNFQTVAQTFKNPLDTSTYIDALPYPGDDEPRCSIAVFENYKFSTIRGFTMGLGETWHSPEQYFSGITHGSGQLETNMAGKTIIAYGPSQFDLDGFAKYEWKKWGYTQSIQLNLYNILNDNELNGFIWTPSFSAKLSYGINF